MRSGQLAVEGLLSVTRDAHYRLVSAGAAVRRTVGRFRPGLIVGLNRLTNRFTDDVLEIPMLGLYGEHRYSAGYLAVEAGRQGGSQVSAGGAVLEGRHRFKTVEVRYSGWSYAVSFVDLTAGSKAGYQAWSTPVADPDRAGCSLRRLLNCRVPSIFPMPFSTRPERVTTPGGSFPAV